MKLFSWLLVLSCLAGSCVPKDPVVLRSVVIREVVPVNGQLLLKADAIFYNPNATRMRLKKIDIEVMVDGKKAAVVDHHVSALIKPKSEFSVPLEVQLNLKEIGILDTLLSLLGGSEHHIEFIGSLKISVNGFPVKVPVRYKEALKF